MLNPRPTEEAYAELQQCFDFYNAELFDGQLPHCLITFQREKRTMGYFSRKRFVRMDGTAHADEIALNPEYFAIVPLIEVLQTVVHEMVHAWQFHFGTPSRACYHNTEWANKMEAIGLMPSDTGAPGGKRTGQKMGDYPVPGGRFMLATQRLLASGFAISWLDRFPAHAPVPQVSTSIAATLKQHPASMVLEANAPQEDVRDNASLGAYAALAFATPAQTQAGLELQERGLGNRSNRSKYTCPGCGNGVWGKPRLNVICGDCNNKFSEEGEGHDG